MLSILTGCSGVTTDRFLSYKHEDLAKQGKPPAYIEGYVDGCSSGMRMGGDTHFDYRKDVQRAERDALYAKGWDDGQICCRNEAILEKQRQEEIKREGYDLTAERQRRSDAANDAEMREIWEQLKK